MLYPRLWLFQWWPNAAGACGDKWQSARRVLQEMDSGECNETVSQRLGAQLQRRHCGGSVLRQAQRCGSHGGQMQEWAIQSSGDQCGGDQCRWPSQERLWAVRWQALVMNHCVIIELSIFSNGSPSFSVMLGPHLTIRLVSHVQVQKMQSTILTLVSWLLILLVTFSDSKPYKWLWVAHGIFSQAELTQTVCCRLVQIFWGILKFTSCLPPNIPHLLINKSSFNWPVYSPFQRGWFLHFSYFYQSVFKVHIHH